MKPTSFTPAWRKILIPMSALVILSTMTVEARTPWFLSGPKKVVQRTQNKVSSTANRVARALEEGGSEPRRVVRVKATSPTAGSRQGQVIYVAPSYAAATGASYYDANQNSMVRSSSYAVSSTGSASAAPQLVMNGVVYAPNGQPLAAEAPAVNLELQQPPVIDPATKAPTPALPQPNNAVPNVPEKNPLPYARPVPGTNGFVYPPDAEPKPENMIDVRDFRSGQKVRNPKTGEVFLVP